MLYLGHSLGEGITSRHKAVSVFCSPHPANWVMFVMKELSKYISNRVEGGARGVMVILAGNGLGDTSSNPGRD